MNKTRNKAKNSGLSALAMSFVLPHENKPQRLPVVPATLTALLNVMSDGTVPVPDGVTRRAFLCRDPCYPLWIERTFTDSAGYLTSNGSHPSIVWTIPPHTNAALAIPNWESVTSDLSAQTVDGQPSNPGAIVDYTVIGDVDEDATQAIYIPPGSTFSIRIFTGATTGGSGIAFDIAYRVGGEVFVSTVVATAISQDYRFSGVAASTTPAQGSIVEGVVPVGFAWIRAIRTTASAPPSATNCHLSFGWCTGGTVGGPSGTCTAMVPFSMPPEFNNSTLPYGRTRLNASAALFTNVTAALSKEGTVLAARLKPSVVDPWLFTLNHVNSVHPDLRYYGPLEKGLYTFTTPSGNVDSFTDNWITMPSSSTYNKLHRPLFNFQDIGLYNAVLLSDLGSAATGTQLAVSCYAHLEFETTSSLFSPGVSLMPLEMLHAAEVALLKFGHFHENPLHWATIAAAAKKALAIVGPMVAPYAQAAVKKVASAGLQYLSNRVGGDRKMQQDLAPRRAPPPQRKKKARAGGKRKK